jgi:hypothetical protein
VGALSRSTAALLQHEQELAHSYLSIAAHRLLVLQWRWNAVDADSEGERHDANCRLRSVKGTSLPTATPVTAPVSHVTHGALAESSVKITMQTSVCRTVVMIHSSHVPPARIPPEGASSDE